MGDTKADIIREHLPYEVRMMRYTARELEHPFEDDLANNAVIEANAVHLRNLLDFLYNQNGDFQAKDFVPTNHLLSGKQTFPSDVGRLYGSKLHDQILHMGEKRTTVEANKLSAADRKILIDAIKNKLVEFKGALAQTAYNDLWNEQAMDAGPFSPKGLTRRRGGLPPAESTTAPPGT